MILLVALSASPTIAQGESEWYYYDANKEKIPLELDESAVAVFDFEPGLGRDVAGYLHSAGLRGFATRPLGPAWSLFARESASAAPQLAAGQASITGLIHSIAHRPDNLYFLSPVFKFPGGARAYVPPDVLIRFHEDVSPSYAKILIQAAGAPARKIGEA